MIFGIDAESAEIQIAHISFCELLGVRLKSRENRRLPQGFRMFTTYYHRGSWWIMTLLKRINLFTHTFSQLRRRLPMSDPSTAAARLQVIGMTCDVAGPLAATRRHSDRPGFDHLDRAGVGCCLTDDARDVMLEATKVNAGFRYARVYRSQPSR